MTNLAILDKGPIDNIIVIKLCMYACMHMCSLAYLALTNWDVGSIKLVLVASGSTEM